MVPSMRAPRSRLSAASATDCASSRGRAGCKRFTARCLWKAIGCLAILGLADPAVAQVAVEAAVLTDYRVRGYSMSDGQPAASLSAAYDHPSGFYAGGTAIGSIRNGNPELLSVQGNVGYAVRLTPDLSWDAGLYQAEYFSHYAVGEAHYYSGSSYGVTQTHHYTELYAGLTKGALTTRVSFSPNYFNEDNPTLYAEVEGGIEPAPSWFVSAHAGTLSYLKRQPDHSPRQRYDWRFGVSRQFGNAGIHLDLSGSIDESRAGTHGKRTAVVLSATQAF